MIFNFEFKNLVKIHEKVYHIYVNPLKEFEKDIVEAFLGSGYEEQEVHIVVHWEISEKRLFLTDMIISNSNNDLSVFPKEKEEIFANWFSGEIVIKKPKSKILSSTFQDYNFTKKHHYNFKRRQPSLILFHRLYGRQAQEV